MTKYILIGGYPDKAADGGKKLCQEAVTGFPEPVNILICLFARQKQFWAKLFEENKRFFAGNLPDKKLKFTLADDGDFTKQIINNDILYLSGGDTTELINHLQKSPDWLNKLDGKCILGSSAGTDILSKYNYDLELFECADGLGLVPVKTIVHFKSDNYRPPAGWEQALKELENYKERLPIWTLREGEYKIIEI